EHHDELRVLSLIALGAVAIVATFVTAGRPRLQTPLPFGAQDMRPTRWEWAAILAVMFVIGAFVIEATRDDDPGFDDFGLDATEAVQPLDDDPGAVLSTAS